MTGDQRLVIELARWEAVNLGQLVDDLQALLGADRDLDDPAVQRITPTAYPDDVSAARDFASSTRDDLLDRRIHDAKVVKQALRPFHDGTAAAPGAAPDVLSGEAALLPVAVTIATAEVDPWLRTLTALRLVIAERLEITDDDDRDPDDERFGVYDWLGYRLEMLIQTAEENDV